jgi:hypothetical protein
MKFLRSVKRCSEMDRIRNYNIRTELGVFILSHKIEENRDKWEEHLRRMYGAAFPSKLNGERDVVRQKKRWKET